MFKQTTIYLGIILLFVIAVLSTVLVINTNKNLTIQQKNLEITQDLFLGDLTYQYYNDLSNCIDSKIQEGNIEEIESLEEQCREEMKNTNLFEKIKKFGGEELIQN